MAKTQAKDNASIRTNLVSYLKGVKQQEETDQKYPRNHI